MKLRVRNNASSSSPATDMTFTGCTFANNASGGSQGGAVYYENTTSTSVYTNCNFINNSVAGGNGGDAMFIGANETVNKIRNLILLFPKSKTVCSDNLNKPFSFYPIFLRTYNCL